MMNKDEISATKTVFLACLHLCIWGVALYWVYFGSGFGLLNTPVYMRPFSHDYNVYEYWVCVNGFMGILVLAELMYIVGRVLDRGGAHARAGRLLMGMTLSVAITALLIATYCLMLGLFDAVWIFSWSSLWQDANHGFLAKPATLPCLFAIGMTVALLIHRCRCVPLPHDRFNHLTFILANWGIIVVGLAVLAQMFDFKRVVMGDVWNSKTGAYAAFVLALAGFNVCVVVLLTDRLYSRMKTGVELDGDKSALAVSTQPLDVDAVV